MFLFILGLRLFWLAVVAGTYIVIAGFIIAIVAIGVAVVLVVAIAAIIFSIVEAIVTRKPWKFPARWRSAREFAAAKVPHQDLRLVRLLGRDKGKRLKPLKPVEADPVSAVATPPRAEGFALNQASRVNAAVAKRDAARVALHAQIDLSHKHTLEILTPMAAAGNEWAQGALRRAEERHELYVANR